MRPLLVTVLLAALCFHTHAQVFFEDFGEANGSTTGSASGVNWRVSTAPSSGTFSVVANLFAIDGTTNEGVWETDPIDISAYGYAVIDIDMLIGGFGFGAGDYLRAYYDVGGGQVMFAELGGSLFSSSTEGSAIVTGTSLKIYVKGKDTSFFGAFTFDNVTVTGITALYSRKNGDWNDITTGNGTWSVSGHSGASCDCSPNTGVVAIIGNNNTVNMNVDGTTGGIEIRNTGTLTYTAADVDLNIFRGYLIVASGGTVNRNSQNNARINFTNDVVSTTTFNGNVTIDDITVTDNATLDFTGSGSLVVNDDILIQASATDFTNNISGVFTITDRFEFGSGFTASTLTSNAPVSIATIYFGDDNNMVTNNSTITMSSGILGASANADNNTFTNSSGATLTLVSINPAGGVLDISNSGTINQSGNFTNIDAASNFQNLNGSVWNWSYVPGTAPDSDMSTVLDCSTATNTFNYNGAGAQSVLGTTYHHVIFQDSGTKTLLAALDANGNITIQNAAILNSSTFNITVGGNWSVLNTASFTEGTNTVTFDGTTQSISDWLGTETFYNVVFSGSGTKTSSVILDVNNNLNISGTARLDASNNPITLVGNWVVTSTNADPFGEGTSQITFDGTGTQTVTTALAAGETFYALDITQSGNKTNSSILSITDDFNLGGTAQFTAGNTFNIGGDWVVVSTNANPFVEGTTTTNFNGTGNQTISTVLAAGETFYNLTFSGSGTKTNISKIDVNNNLTISGTAQYDGSNFDLTVAGNWAVTSTNGNPFVEGTKKVTLDGTVAQGISTVLAAGETFYDLETSGNTTKTYNNQINITRNLDINATSRLAANAALTIGGNWSVASTNTNPFAEGTQTVTFNGTSDQTIKTVLGTETFYNLVLNKTSGGLKLATGASTTDLVIATNGTMTFTNGILTTTATESLTFSDEALVSGGSNTSFVDGEVIKVGEDPFIFPTGDQGIWARIEMNPTGANNTSTFTAQYLSSAPSNSSSLSGVSRISAGEYWEFTRSGTLGTGATLKLYWEDGSRSGINSVAAGTLVVSYYNGTNWVSAGGTIAGSTTSGSVVSNSITAANLASGTKRNVTFGSSATLPTNPLPVEFGSFEANLAGEQVALSWSTLQEHNNDYFSIERSADGEEYMTIGNIPGVGNNTYPETYQYIDQNPLTGRSYYRLRQTDLDGNYAFHPKIRMINFDGLKEPVLEVYPNPNEGTTVTLQIRGLTGVQSLPVKFYTLQGQKVLELELYADDNGLIISDLELRSRLKPGVYIIKAGKTLLLTTKLNLH